MQECLRALEAHQTPTGALPAQRVRRLPLRPREAAEGNFQFWDPASRIFFSGDLGVSIGVDPAVPIRKLAPHVPRMEAFHRRYMASRKVLQRWAHMVRGLPIAMIAPQHGAPITGPAVREFIDWVEQLDCGIELFGQQNYVVP